MQPPTGTPDYQRIAREFGLGRLLAVSPAADDHPAVVKLTTALGSYLVKPAYRAADAELYEQVARHLGRAGIRQPRPLRTTAGAMVGACGYTVQEFLPGRASLRPTPRQTAAAMRHLGRYHAALASFPVPDVLPGHATVWQRVTSPGYLLAELPGLLLRSGLAAGQRQVVARALARTEASLPSIAALPVQLVHGDIGPDNVLMDGDEVVAVVDFTPHRQPALFALATGVYWYHVHGHRTVDADAIRASVAAASGGRDLTGAERTAWPGMLMLEALRRLATPFAVAAETGARPGRAGTRYQAVQTVLQSLPPS